MSLPLDVTAAVLIRHDGQAASRSEQRQPLTVAHDWSGVAECESAGNWTADTGNGFYGGLQFAESTWLAEGGGEFAARADLATQVEQIVVAERVLQVQGVGAWPTCGRYLRGAA